MSVGKKSDASGAKRTHVSLAVVQEALNQVMNAIQQPDKSTKNGGQLMFPDSWSFTVSVGYKIDKKLL